MVVLTHINDMIMIQNQILGEQFKGLNESFNKLISRECSAEVLSEEFRVLSGNISQLCLIFNEQEKKINSVFAENSDIRNDLSELQNLNNILKNELAKLTTKAKEKFKYMLEEINLLKQEKLQSTIAQESAEKSIKTLTDELELLKTKMKQIKLRKNVDSDNIDEKMCQKCKKIYKESENFNWSCKVHVSQCVNDFWWCCGKKGENAPGCQAGRHESKEDDNELLKNDDAIKNILLCTSCKAYGHNSFNCPKDPNTKTGVDIKHEIERLERLKKHKTSNCIGTESNQKVFELLFNRGALAFANESFSAERCESDESEEQDEKFFIDIMGLKKNMYFDSHTTQFFKSDTKVKK